MERLRYLILGGVCTRRRLGMIIRRFSGYLLLIRI